MWGVILAGLSAMWSSAHAQGDDGGIHVRFDEGHTLDLSLIDHGLGWEAWTPQFESPIVKLDPNGWPGAFSTGEESRAVLSIPRIDPSAGPVRLEFAAAIPDTRSHSTSYVQVGLGDSAQRFATNPVITVSVTGLLIGDEIGVTAASVQPAFREGTAFVPTPGQTIHVRCDFDFAAGTAAISVSEDGGSTYVDLSPSTDGTPFSVEPFDVYDRVYLRLGNSTATGVYSISVSQ